MRKALHCSALVALAGAYPAYAEEAPICTDRPARANAVCTVPAGKFQLESALVDWIRTNAAGTRTDVLAIGPSFMKFGLTDHSDLQLGFTPFLDVRVKQDGPNAHASGVGDVTIRYKHRLTPDDARIQIAAIPFVKLPTANHALGNGKVEGGLAVPVSVSTGSPVTIVLGPEFDLVADSDGTGRHLQLVNLINVSRPVAPRFTVAGELWTAINFDPSGTVTQVSLDSAAAYAVSNRLQLDVGTNVGLNRSTPDIEVYAGFSIRF
jgi:hypothetical protein